MTITSRGNASVKRARRLRARPAREQAGLAYVEGVRQVAEAVLLGAEIEQLIVAPDLLRSDFARELVEDAAARGIALVEVTPEVFASLALKEHPQGLAAVVRQRWLPLHQADPGAGLCWVALEAVADPGNLGTILRTCEAVGAAGLILLGQSTDPYDPVAIRASTGAVFSQRLARATLDQLTAWVREGGGQLVGAALEGSRDYATAEYRRPLLILLGSERQGLSAEARAHCDQLVRIPMVGRSDSLNLAVATGVLLYEVFNRSRARAAE